jgi:multiple sugar transport system substrate-binding protein
MSSKRILVRVSIIFAIAGLVALSLRGPDRRTADLSFLMEPDGTGAWHNLLDEFERQHPNVRVQLVEGPPGTDVREDMYSTSFLSGEAAYDLVYCDVISLPKFAAAGWLLDLTDRVTPADTTGFLETDLKAGMYKGHLYRIPAFTDSGILYYRKDLASQPPETFDDLVRLSKQFQSDQRYGFLWQGKQYEGLVTVYLEILWGYGGDWIDTETHEVLLDRPEALEALEFLRSTIGTISPPSVTTYMEEDTRVLFQNCRSVFLRNWPYVWKLLEQTPQKTARFGMAPVVHAPGHASAGTLGGWGFAISKYTRDPDMAWKLVQFLTSPEQLAKIQSRMGRIPARRTLVPAAFAPMLNAARMRPQLPEYAQASDILQRWLSAALTGRISPESALSHAARETRLLLGD